MCDSLKCDTYLLYSTVTRNENIQSIVLCRLLHRYTNVRLKEFTKQVKETINVNKTKAIRDSLNKRKMKGKSFATARSLVEETFIDDSAKKTVSHLKLRAHALSGNEPFKDFSKVQLHFLNSIYSLQFARSKKKCDLAKELQSIISNADQMAIPEIATKACYNLLAKSAKESKHIRLDEICKELGVAYTTGPQNDGRGSSVETEMPNQGDDTEEHILSRDEPSSDNRGANAVIEDTIHVGARRKPFRPDPQQEQVLANDHEVHNGKIPMSLVKQRAAELNVDPTQIRRWHSVRRRKNASS